MAENDTADVAVKLVQAAEGKAGMTWHVYGLIDPRDRAVFYIGCSKSYPY